MKINKIFFLGLAMLLAACSADDATQEQPSLGILSFSTTIENFEGEDITRTNFDGNAFENGDKIKLKIICPFSTHTEFGETTYGNSFDAFWLLKWDADKWSTLTSADGFDINGDYSPSASPNIYDRYEAQQTPYVYTAQTWSEEQIFIAGKSTRVEQYSNVFHANQTKAADYKASDLMWAQTIQQTGSYNVHLSFKHVMSALLVTVDVDASLGISDNAVLTLEGMPDIDQAEVIVGDYYAAKSKVNSNNYGYKSKHSCTQAKNGTVIGVAVVDDSQAKAYTKAIGTISQDGIYTAYNAGSKTYRLIVPPCTLSNKATFWLRNGEKRYSMQLTQTTFEAGKLYKVKMTI
ncbi:fimbrillin family protein [uncultured Prevotella sp.]|uniref:fimbrillin family protein n=1 Tax=uncultured Prevotella sp. TaxID=159272 RepID=UPI002586E2CB|nr:fimbrillin family protein [uncultured Prevotella sp.]